MRFLIISALCLLCGCGSLSSRPPQLNATTRTYAPKPADTLQSIAGRRYGHPNYGVLIAYHNNLPMADLQAVDSLELPDIEHMVLAMSALKEHQETVVELLRARALFCSLAPDLHRARGKTPLGVDKALPIDLTQALTDAAASFQEAEGELVQLRAVRESYPERLHASIEHVVEEIRTHASGRYHGRRLSVHQTEGTVASVFGQLLTWQRVLAGDLPAGKLAFPRSSCGG